MFRNDCLQQLKNDSFDLLIIGGGATGAGIALDATARGLKVALIEQSDFGFGTSSRSTKLVHGGVRYLEQAVMHLDRSQFRLVREALRERKVLTEIAPHLVRWIPLLIPMYKRFEATYYNAGLRMYDWLAGKNLVHRSRFVSPKEALELCPFLKRSGLKGGVIYYDGQFDDSRMNLSVLLAAKERGATVGNYIRVNGFRKTNGLISGVDLEDTLTKEKWFTSAKVVVNATGPFTDTIRKLNDPESHPLLKLSSGAHIVLPLPSPDYHVGVLIPKTQDKRVLFVLPWLGKMLIGTTDNAAKITDDPKASAEDISFIVNEYARCFDKPLDEKQILSAWSGLRPLADESKSGGTASLSRDHSIEETSSGLISIFGGKWTTYRLMAEDVVDKVVSRFSKKTLPCTTHQIKLYGAQRLSEALKKEALQQSFSKETTEHLWTTYGDRISEITEIAAQGYSNLFHPEHPLIEAEVVFSARKEMVARSSDILFRRTRLAFLDKKAAEQCFVKVHTLLAAELNWTEADKQSDRTDFNSQL